MSTYTEFLARKRGTVSSYGIDGFASGDLDGGLFDFQCVMTSWAVRQGRAALFADTGLGNHCYSTWKPCRDLVDAFLCLRPPPLQGDTNTV